MIVRICRWKRLLYVVWILYIKEWIFCRKNLRMKERKHQSRKYLRRIQNVQLLIRKAFGCIILKNLLRDYASLNLPGKRGPEHSQQQKTAYFVKIMILLIYRSKYLNTRKIRSIRSSEKI